MKMRTTKIKVHDITMRYYDSKNEGKEVLVLLHFGGATLVTWNGVIPYLKDHYRLIALDLRCHGFSDYDVESCHLDDMAKDVQGLMDHLQIDKAYIVGSSLGADVAISFAALFPKRTIAIVLDGGVYDLVGPDSKDQIITDDAIAEAQNKLKEQILGRETKEFDSKDDYMEYCKKGWEGEKIEWSSIIHGYELDKLIETENGKFITIQTKEAIWKFIEPLYGIRFQDYFDKINCPVLWLPDEQECDHEVVKRNLKNYSANLPYHKIVTLEGSVHAYTPMLKPEEFSNEVMKFIDEIKK
ncbi:MAG: alpha/beta hydrolase [Asgard group archaeon]|nr:alpha/beta hydrolase [Asgard group archaeon]